MKVRILLGTAALFVASTTFSISYHKHVSHQKDIEIESALQKIEEQEKTLDMLEKIILEQEIRLNKFERYERIINDLSSVPEEAQPFVLALCFTESSLRYDIKHKGRFDRTTTGICGIKPDIWGNVLGDNPPNSLYSGYLVLNHLLEKHEDFFAAVAKYKGARTNFNSTERVISLAERIVNYY